MFIIHSAQAEQNGALHDQVQGFLVWNTFRTLGHRNIPNWQVLNALDFKLPQSRRRLWIVGYKTRAAGKSALTLFITLLESQLVSDYLFNVSSFLLDSGEFMWPQGSAKKRKLSSILLKPLGCTVCCFHFSFVSSDQSLKKCAPGRMSCWEKPEFPASKTGKRNLKAGLKALSNANEDEEETWVIDVGASRKFCGKPVKERRADAVELDFELCDLESLAGQAALHHKEPRRWAFLLDNVQGKAHKNEGRGDKIMC